MAQSYVAKANLKLLKLASASEYKGTELKHYQAFDGAASLSTSFLSFSMNPVSAGVGVDQRVGREVRLKGVEVSGWFQPSDTSQVVRVIIENREAGVTAVPDITFGASVNASLVFAESKHRFYSDDYVGFPPTVNATGLTYPTIPYSRFIPLNLKVRWNAAADIVQNACYVHMASDSAAVTHPQFIGHVRYFFTDA
jgi:hypothetical protein